MVYLEVTKSLGRPKLTANEAIGQSAQWMVEDQKRWIQQASLRPMVSPMLSVQVQVMGRS